MTIKTGVLNIPPETWYRRDTPLGNPILEILYCIIYFGRVHFSLWKLLIIRW